MKTLVVKMDPKIIVRIFGEMQDSENLGPVLKRENVGSDTHTYFSVDDDRIEDLRLKLPKYKFVRGVYVSDETPPTAVSLDSGK